VRAHFDVFAERGLRVGTVRITNGGSKSRLWREILADVLGRDLVSIVDHPGASFGAAVIAGVGVGRIADWSYVKGALAEGEVVSPDERHLALYEERYQQYRQLSEATTPILHVLARGSH
jgi:xylulokinase